MPDTNDFLERIERESRERMELADRQHRRTLWQMGAFFVGVIAISVAVGIALSKRVAENRASFMANCVEDRGEAKRYECRLLWSHTRRSGSNVTIQLTPAGSGGTSVVVQP